ncbi:aromatic-ring-hydroxylating dioxygenase subunit beta [Streptomyces canus]|uniref:aromatic-ring-hydroxylating dioxygenase subunit beta n=1 Tax=Streptomyces canus TaxID=58343 RepID=UPI0037200381
MSDRNLIQDLLSRYGWLHDERRFDELGSCFTDDARYTMHIGQDQTIGPRIGRLDIVEQIRQFKEAQNDQRRHVISNFMFMEHLPEEATVRSYVTVLASAGGSTGIVTAGWYLDKVVSTPDGWRIAEKTLQLDNGF